MLHQLARFFRPSVETQHAYQLYACINEEARQARFFIDWQVPDTLDGRFELILLHMFLYLERLKEMEEDTTGFQQQLIEAFFEDMDRSIREMGVGDTGVGKRVKAMANAFYGRMHAYSQALNHDEALEYALATNLYGTVDTPPDTLAMVVSYIHARLEALEQVNLLEPDAVTRDVP